MGTDRQVTPTSKVPDREERHDGANTAMRVGLVLKLIIFGSSLIRNRAHP